MNNGHTIPSHGRIKGLLTRVIRRATRAGVPEPMGDGLVSFAQQGEDMILNCLFQGHQAGFYVDVGAHHPTRYSNTYFFYLRGWRGINIDAMPGSMGPFRDARPEDINLECAIAETRETRTFYLFHEPAVNGFSPELSESRAAEGHFQPVGQREVPTVPLAEVLETHLPHGRTIDFLNVDAEGLDLEVLRSNDWSRFRPKLVVAEDTGVFLLEEMGRSGIIEFLRGQGYSPCAKAVHSWFLADESRLVMRPDRFFQ